MIKSFRSGFLMLVVGHFISAVILYLYWGFCSTLTCSSLPFNASCGRLVS